MLNSKCNVIKEKNEGILEIISHDIEYGIYEKEVLLSLEIEPLHIDGYDSEDIVKQILELHFDEDSKEYICTMIYDLDEFGESEDSFRYYTLNNEQKEYINNFIKEKDLDFLI